MLDFDQLDVTTMTFIVNLRGSVNIDYCFPLLPITKVELPVQIRSKKKFKLPFCDRPGSILSSNYKGMTRGIIKSRSSRFFRNSMTLDICTTTKNVNLKLSKKTIQMCGTKSPEMAKETTDLIISILNSIQYNLDYMNSDLERTMKTVEWIKNKCKGSEFVINAETQEIIPVDEGDVLTNQGMIKRKTGSLYTCINSETGCLQFLIGRLVNEIIVPEEYPNCYSNEVDSRLANFFLRYAGDYLYYTDYINFIDDVLHIKDIIERPLEVENLLPAMINYSYTLGANINRENLSRNIMGRSGFVSSYRNTTDHSIKIELPYEPADDTKKVRKKSKQPKHTFMVHKSGLVTQSSPNRELAHQAYDKFKNLITTIRSDVIQRGRPYRLKINLN